MASPSVVAGLLAFALVLLLPGCNDDDDDGESQVLAVNACPPTRCVDALETVDLIGWDFLEPAALPDGYDLYSRNVERDPPSPGVPSESYVVFHDFRFRGSPNVPAILMSQSHPLGDAGVSLRPQSEECGALQQSATGPYYYAEGLIRLLASPEGNVWLVCVDDEAGHPGTHSIVLVRDGILVELLSFPESGVTREEMLTFIDSLAPVSAAPD